MELKGHKSSITSLAFSPDASLLISSSNDKDIFIWSVETGDVIKTLKGHDGEVNAVRFSADGTRIISVDSEFEIIIWDAATYEIIHTIISSWYLCIAISPDNRYFAVGTFYGGIDMWSLDTAEEKETMYILSHLDRVNSIEYNKDGSRLVSGSSDNSIKIWTVQPFQMIKEIKGHSAAVTSVAFINDSVVLSASRDRTLRTWNVDSATILSFINAHAADITSMALSSDSIFFITGSTDHTVKIWNTIHLEEMSFLTDHRDSVQAVAISADGQRIASGDCHHVIILRKCNF